MSLNNRSLNQTELSVSATDWVSRSVFLPGFCTGKSYDDELMSCQIRTFLHPNLPGLFPFSAIICRVARTMYQYVVRHLSLPTTFGIEGSTMECLTLFFLSANLV